MLIVIELERDRDRGGRLHVEDGGGRILAGPFPAAGRATDHAARRFGNPDRVTTLPYGDTPLGEYRVIRVVRGTVEPAASFGAHGVVVMEGTAGDAGLAEANGRFVILIHGGEAGAGGALRCTNGAIRLHDDDMEELLAVLLPGDDVRCVCRETLDAFGEAATQIDTAFDCFDGDAIHAAVTLDEEPDHPFGRGVPWITPRYVKATSVAVVAHGEYDPGGDDSGGGDDAGGGDDPGGDDDAGSDDDAGGDDDGDGAGDEGGASGGDSESGTHIEIRDGMSIEVRDGFHLENRDGQLTEVADGPGGAGHDGPQDPGPQNPSLPDDGHTPDPPSGGSVVTGPDDPHPPHEPHEHPDPPQPAPTPVPTPPSDPRAAVAQRLLSNPRITLATRHVTTPLDNATARQNLIDTAAGRPAARSVGVNAPGGTVVLSERMLRAIEQLSQSFSFSVSEVAGGDHGAGSVHFAGTGVDFNVIDGVGVSVNNPRVGDFRQACIAAGATFVRGPGDDAAHATHVHCRFP